MSRSIEQMKTLISDANKKINELEAQVASAVEYKINLVKQLSEVIAESTVAPKDINSGIIIESGPDDINADSLIGYAGHGLVTQPTAENQFKSAEKDGDGNLVLETDIEVVIDKAEAEKKTMALIATEAATVAKAKAENEDTGALNKGEKLEERLLEQEKQTALNEVKE